MRYKNEAVPPAANSTSSPERCLVDIDEQIPSSSTLIVIKRNWPDRQRPEPFENRSKWRDMPAQAAAARHQALEGTLGSGRGQRDSSSGKKPAILSVKMIGTRTINCNSHWEEPGWQAREDDRNRQLGPTA